MTGNFTSKVLDIRHIYCFALQYIITGSAFGGTITFQGSNDATNDPENQPPTNWSTVGSPVTVSAAGSTIVNFDGQGYAFFRVIYATSGSPNGSLTVLFNGKGA